MNVSKNFTLRELSCPCGKCEPVVDKGFIDRLQRLRDAFDKPMVINSWYRCDAHNKAVGGATSSMHRHGRAVDIAMTNSADRFQLVYLGIVFGFTGIGTYSGWIHLDDRDGAPTMWVG